MMVAERVNQVLRLQLGEGFDWDGRTKLMGFGEGLELDSLDMVELIMGLENEFKIEIPDDAIWLGCWPRLETVGDLVSYVDQQLAKKPALFAA